jgi:hypothetical protein
MFKHQVTPWIAKGFAPRNDAEKIVVLVDKGYIKD